MITDYVAVFCCKLKAMGKVSGSIDVSYVRQRTKFVH